MSAILVGAYVVQSHLFLSSASLSLEENRLSMAALGASVIFRPWQSWVRNDIRHDVGQLAKSKNDKNKGCEIIYLK